VASNREQVIRAALELDSESQVALLDLLIEHLDLGTEAGVEEAWNQEIDRRIGQLERGEVVSVPFNLASARLKLSGGG
jgi:hypothetical protein